jgi:hypothetical protein
MDVSSATSAMRTISFSRSLMWLAEGDAVVDVANGPVLIVVGDHQVVETGIDVGRQVGQIKDNDVVDDATTDDAHSVHMANIS